MKHYKNITIFQTTGLSFIIGPWFLVKPQVAGELRGSCRAPVFRQIRRVGPPRFVTWCRADQQRLWIG